MPKLNFIHMDLLLFIVLNLVHLVLRPRIVVVSNAVFVVVMLISLLNVQYMKDVQNVLTSHSTNYV